MKIHSVKAYAVHLPFHTIVSDSLGAYHGSNHGIVVIEAESGHYGVGEIALAWFGGAHSLCKEVNEWWAPFYVGEDPRNINRLMKKTKHLLHFSKRHLLAQAGIEMALYDLVGKMYGMPVYQLLGGKMRDSVPLTGGVNMDSPDIMVETAIEKVSQGYKELKIKVGLDPKRDLVIIRNIRKAIPDHVLMRVDANMAFNHVKDAKAWMDEVHEYGVHIVEQPLSVQRIEDLAWLRENTKTLLLLDESVWNAEDAKQCLEANAADMLHVYSNEAGGLTTARTIFELASLYQIPCTIGSMPEARIGASASLHLGITMDNLSEYASDIRGFTAYREDVVMQELDLRDGCLYVNDVPGLGVTVDFEKLNHYTVQI